MVIHLPRRPHLAIPRITVRWPRLSLPFDQDDVYKLFALVLGSLLTLWVAADVGLCVRVFLALSGLR